MKIQSFLMAVKFDFAGMQNKKFAFGQPVRYGYGQGRAARPYRFNHPF
jgi:hypothetical protein